MARRGRCRFAADLGWNRSRAFVTGAGGADADVPIHGQEVGRAAGFPGVSAWMLADMIAHSQYPWLGGRGSIEGVPGKLPGGCLTAGIRG